MKIIPIALLTMLSFAILVSATIELDSSGAYNVEIPVREGWNLVAATLPSQGIASDSDIQIEDIVAAWLFTTLFGELSPTGEYVRAYPDPDMDRIQRRDDTEMLRNAMWINVKKEGVFKYSTIEIYKELNARNLWKGWNFLTITPDMIGHSLWQIKGTCDFKSVNNWARDRWGNDIDEFEFLKSDRIAGIGIVVKVKDDCKLKSYGKPSEDTSSPPGLPGDQAPQDSYSVKCVDTDGGLDYYAKGATYYGEYDYVDDCARHFGTVNAGTPQEYTLEEGDLIEYACYDSDNAKRCSTAACRFIKFHCPNGCKDGACVR